MIGTRTNEKIFWNHRAENYPLPFARDPLAKTRRILRILESMGADFKGRRILDIGCGAGNYSLPLAARTKYVLGVDSSPAMLKLFRAERRRRRITNAACALSRWSDLPADKLRGRFDIALASMTMAIKSRKDLLKMEAAAIERCVYIGWAGLRHNTLMEQVYGAHGLEYRAPSGSETVLAELRALGRKYTIRFIRDSWDKKLSPAKTLREIEIGLRVNGVKIKTEWVKGFLKRFMKKNLVKQNTTVRKAVITWRVPTDAPR